MASNKKPSWTITRQISTGKLLFNYWDNKDVDKSDKESLQPHSFHDDLTYDGFYFTASGGKINWRSKTFPKTKLSTSLQFMMDLFSEIVETKSQIVDVKPLSITGKFKFVKRGSEIRIIEDE